MGELIVWDVRLDYFQIKVVTSTFYPAISFVNNIGFGRTDASNTFGYSKHKTKLNNFKMKEFCLPKLFRYDKTISDNLFGKSF